MSSILDKLKAYYETTSSEQIKKDWEKTAVYDKIGPSVDSYLEQTAYYRELSKMKSNHWEFKNYNNNNTINNPEFSSDFFLI